MPVCTFAVAASVTPILDVVAATNFERVGAVEKARTRRVVDQLVRVRERARPPSMPPRLLFTAERAH